MERLSQEEIGGLGYTGGWENIEAYDNPVYVERRVGYAVVKYFDEYYKAPHHLVSENKEQGDDVFNICSECFTETMYDTQQQEFYCPICNNE